MKNDLQANSIIKNYIKIKKDQLFSLVFVLLCFIIFDFASVYYLITCINNKTTDVVHCFIISILYWSQIVSCKDIYKDIKKGINNYKYIQQARKNLL